MRCRVIACVACGAAAAVATSSRRALRHYCPAHTCAVALSLSLYLSPSLLFPLPSAPPSLDRYALPSHLLACDGAEQLVHALLSPQPTSRPTGEALENHPFFFALECGFDTIAECAPALTPSLAHAELLAELDSASALSFERAMRGGDDADFFALPSHLMSPGLPGLDTPGRADRSGYGGGAAGMAGHDRTQSAPAELSTPPRRLSGGAGAGGWGRGGGDSSSRARGASSTRGHATTSNSSVPSAGSIGGANLAHLDQFLLPGERIALTGFVWKKPKLIGRSRRRRLLLLTKGDGAADGAAEAAEAEAKLGALLESGVGAAAAEACIAVATAAPRYRRACYASVWTSVGLGALVSAPGDGADAPLPLPLSPGARGSLNGSDLASRLSAKVRDARIASPLTLACRLSRRPSPTSPPRSVSSRPPPLPLLLSPARYCVAK